MALTPDLLYTRAGELLAYAAGLLDGIERAYVGLATPALDCPNQLTVHATLLGRQPGIYPALQQGLPTAQATNQVTFVLILVRCIPVPGDDGSPPLPAAYEAASELLLSDLWKLWRGIPAGVRNGALWTGCEDMTFGPAAPIAESGGYAGWQLPITREVQAE